MKGAKKKLQLVAATLLASSLFSFPVPSFAASNVTPNTVNISVAPNESKSFDVNVTTDEQPIPQLDVAFAIDRTGSMGDEINVAKEKSIEIMKQIKELVPDSSFSVVSFMDYPGVYKYPGYSYSYGTKTDIAFEINQKNTNDIDAVADAINRLTLGEGDDLPESYTRVLYELSEGTNGWRPSAKKVAIVIGDAPTHDLDFAGYNYGGDPGRDGIAETKDDLDFETVVQQLNEQNITVLAVQGHANNGEKAATATFKGMSEGYDKSVGTKGQYFLLKNATEIPKAIVNMIKNETNKIKKLTLEIPQDYQSWIQLDQSEYTDVGPSTTKTFRVTVTPPKGTADGTYNISLRALGDGAYLGATELTVNVKSPGQAKEDKVVLDHLEASESNIFLQPKQSLKLKVYAVYSDGTVKEITSDKKTVYRTKSGSIATASKGIVKAGNKEGNTDLLISYAGKSLTIPVAVGKKKIVSLEVSAPSLKLNVGQTKQIELYAVYEDGSVKNVTDLAYWLTDDSTIVQVDRGDVEGVEAGIAVVTGRYNGQEAYVSVEVVDEADKGELLGLELSDKNLKMKVGEEQEVSVWAVYESGHKEDVTEDVVWQSRKSSIANVVDGVVEAKKEGETSIVVTYKGKSVTLTVKVAETKVVSLSASTKRVTLTEGGQKQITLFALLDGGEKVDVTKEAEWSVRRNSIAEVEKGLVKGVGKGTTTVVAKYGGKSITISITVK
ncbi:MAG: VWA domain-containing protein [Anoxybacillus sp.]|nr:vWA domain-containing protein [Anoxybacillus sp.]MCL6586217.1 VWA domain-containing protein [Anoxybacillus sp.]